MPGPHSRLLPALGKKPLRVGIQHPSPGQGRPQGSSFPWQLLAREVPLAGASVIPHSSEQISIELLEVPPEEVSG